MPDDPAVWELANEMRNLCTTEDAYAVAEKHLKAAREAQREKDARIADSYAKAYVGDFTPGFVPMPHPHSAAAQGLQLGAMQIAQEIREAEL